MHVPDGILSPEVCLAAGALSAGAVGYSLHRLKDSLADRIVPMTGMTAALVFAGQMVNFPIGLPVAGHLIGGVLAAVILGPWGGTIAMALVIVVQCLLFADGGLLALGINVLNMGVVGALGGYAVYAAVRRALGGGFGATVGAAVIASWLSVMAAAALFCLQLGLSRLPGEYDYANIFTLMVAFHSLIGIGEAAITGGVVSFVLARRPDLLFTPETARSPLAAARRTAAAGVVVAMAVAAFIAPFASTYDDGLEAVAQRARLDELEAEPRILLFDDYQVPLPVAGWEQAAAWQKISISLAGLVGTGAVAAIALALGRAVRPRVARDEG